MFSANDGKKEYNIKQSDITVMYIQRNSKSY